MHKKAGTCKSIRDTHTHNPFLQDRTEGRSPVRDTHTHIIPAYKTAQRAGCRSGTHTNTQTLPTRPHRGQVAGQGHTHTHTQSLPTRPHRGQVAGQGHTHTHNPCLQDRTEGRSPVRDTHTHTHNPCLTRPHRGQVAGQGHTHTHNPCLQDRTESRSPVRDTHTPTRPHIGLVVGQGDTRYHLKSYELTTRFWPCPISNSSNNSRQKSHSIGQKFRGANWSRSSFEMDDSVDCTSSEYWVCKGWDISDAELLVWFTCVYIRIAVPDNILYM